MELRNPEQRMENDELRQSVKSALSAMPAEWRRALVLCLVQELPGLELTKMIG